MNTQLNPDEPAGMSVSILRRLGLGSWAGRWTLRLGALLRWARLARQVQGATDQTNMAVGLRKIAQHTASERIIFLGEQSHVVAAREEAIEQLAGLNVAALQNVIVDQPKAARQESAFSGRQAVAVSPTRPATGRADWSLGQPGFF